MGKLIFLKYIKIDNGLIKLICIRRKQRIESLS